MRNPRKRFAGCVVRPALAVAAGLFFAGHAGAASLWPPQNVLYGGVMDAAPDPVDANAGGFYFDLPLLELGGPMDLGFRLDYRSTRGTSMMIGDVVAWGKWWWHPKYLLKVNALNSTNYFQFQIDKGEAIAFRQNPDDSFSLVEASTFGVPGSNSPTDYQLKGDANWLYLLDPPRGRVLIFNAYSSGRWRVAAAVDRNGNHWTYSYDPAVGDLRPTRIADEAGRTLDFYYGTGGITNVADHTGRSVQFIYEPAAPDNRNSICLRFVVDASGQTNRFDYTWTTDSYGGTDNHLVAAHTLPVGNVPWQQAYTAVVFYAEDPYEHAAVAEQTDAYGHAISFQYDTDAHTLAVAWPDGGTNRYASSGRHIPVAEIVAPGGAQTTFTVDGRNRLAGMTDATGAGIGLAFDPTNAMLAAVTNAAGEVLRFEYAATQQEIANPVAPGESATFTFYDLATIRHPDGTSEEFFYDGAGNVTSSLDRAGQATAYAYDAQGNLIERTPPGGGAATFAYDAAGRLIEAADADGVTNRFDYDALDRVTNVVDGAGNATAYEYDAAGRVVRIVHPDGLETVFAYDANGNRLETTARDGAVVSAAFDLMDRVETATNALGGVSARAYDAMGYLAEVVGADGATNRYQYDHAGRVTNETRVGISVAAAYDAEGRLTSRVSGRGGVETFAYDADGRLVAATNALGRGAHFTRDAAGRVTNAVDALGGRTSAVYADGRLVAQTDAEGRAVQLAYDAAGRLSAITDPLGHHLQYAYSPAGRLTNISHSALILQPSSFSYDAAGRLKTTTDPLGRNTAYEYDAMGRVNLATDSASNEWQFAFQDDIGLRIAANPLGGQATTISAPGGYPVARFDSETDPWTFQWDAADRLVETADPLGNVTTVAYDDFGRVAAVTNPLGHAVAFEYDADGRLARAIDANSLATVYARDLLGQATSVVDRAGGAATFTYDVLGRPVRAADGDGVAVETDYDATGLPLVRRGGAEAWTNAYDAAGRWTSVSSPLGHVQMLQRDALGRITNAVDAEGEATAYEYDAAGRLVAETDAEGRATAYEYDLLDGLSRVTLPGGAHADYARDALGNVVRVTDLGSNEWTRAWTPMGRWLEDVDPLGRTNACERDELGRVSRHLRADDTTLDVHYDAAGQVTGRVWSAGLTHAYEYDAAGRLISASSSFSPHPSAFSYDAEGRVTNAAVNGQDYSAAWTPGGRLASVGYANAALTVHYAYDPASGRLASVSDDLTGTQVGFVYDADGRLVRQTDSHGGTNDFIYDAAGRVTRIQATPGIDLQYVYDAAGRLVSETRETPKPAGALLQTGADTNQYDTAAQLANPAASYDALGRRTADDRCQYQWSPDNRLTNLTHSSFILQPSSFSYDALGNVTARNVQPLACHPVIGGAPLVDDGTNWYVWTTGGVLLYVVAQAEGHAVHHYRFDHSGNAIALVDASGAVAEAYAYEPGGLELDPAPSALGNPFRFLGRYGIRSEGTNGDLYHIRARWYDARTRAFLSPEPLWPQTDSPHALNPYQYANADPVNFADVSGRDLIPNKALWIMLLTQDFSFGELISEIFLGGRGRSYLNILPEYERKKTTRYGLMPTEGAMTPSRKGNTANTQGHDLWKYSENDGTWQEVDYVAPQKRAVVNQSVLGELDLDRNVWSPIAGGEVGLPPRKSETAPSGDLWRKSLAVNSWIKGLSMYKNAPSAAAVSPVAPSDTGSREVAPRKDLWKRILSENELNEVRCGDAPPAAAAKAVTTHLGRGEKRQTLVEKVMGNQAGSKKTEIKLSFDWEGEDGALDVKPFKLGQSH